MTGIIAGKGLDVGTANLVCAKHDESGDVIIRSIRNAFLDIPKTLFISSGLESSFMVISPLFFFI